MNFLEEYPHLKISKVNVKIYKCNNKTKSDQNTVGTSAKCKSNEEIEEWMKYSVIRLKYFNKNV